MKTMYKILMMSIVLSTVLIFLWTFSIAYSNPSKTVLLTINEYNEANLEMFIVAPLALFCSVYLLVDLFKTFIKEEKNEI